MNVKIDTKEKFTVITPNEADISANMTGELIKLLLGYLNKAVPHLVLNMKNIHSIDEEAADQIAGLQHQFYEKNNSFIICELTKRVEDLLDKKELLETMNVTPTESEAWDIVQMEEIEREILGDFEDIE